MMVIVVVILGTVVMFALCKAGILLPVHIALRLISLMLFCGMKDNGQAENTFSEKEKLSSSKMARVIRIILIVSFFVLLWPYTFPFPSFQELAAGTITLIPISVASNLITSFNANNNFRAKNKISLSAKLTASDMLIFCLILPIYYMCAFLGVALGG